MITCLMYFNCIIVEENRDLPDVVPIFVSVDPHRDTVKAVAEYVKGQWKPPFDWSVKWADRIMYFLFLYFLFLLLVS